LKTETFAVAPATLPFEARFSFWAMKFKAIDGQKIPVFCEFDHAAP